MSTIMARYSAEMAASELVILKLATDDLEILQKRTQAMIGGAVSKQDALSGWWVDFLERLGEGPVETVTYMINVRDIPLGGGCITCITNRSRCQAKTTVPKSSQTSSGPSWSKEQM